MSDPQIESELSDGELLHRISGGENELFEILVRRHNRRLYRVARAVVQSDDEAEDVVQEVFGLAFEHLSDFEGRALFSTWLTRIALRAALRRRRLQRREARPEFLAAARPGAATVRGDQENRVLRHELRRVLEQAIDTLPERYRVVFILRHVEEMSTADTAQCLDITEEMVKARLVRARAVLRQRISAYAEAARRNIFPFFGAQCDRVTANVLARVPEHRQAGRQ